ncbi:Calx-beta domain-containing protein [Cyanobium gracile]|uniref:Type 1 secretion C-terminal target domain (VC_A0849 subclass) n=1 Tax=Cyanobium gracile (strain ATCC 27147 / PCC 6307) TaxID=292564 RepID=K9P4D8_CYAGP|nr:Calx-beta domain-containing protein [Cyanobium gracile]AFY28282.1 type 1 secretion C-terminal target domain (VC_A0849 subclass) [Cyanobium gracile PCC 6307]
MATRTWDGGAATDLWNLADNWDTNVIPSNGDDIVIAPGFGTTIFNGSSPLASLAVTSLDSGSNLTVSGGLLSVSGTASFAAALSITGGTLELNGSSSINTFAQSSGSLSGTGTVTITGPSTITFGDHRGSGTTILQGPTTISGSGLRLDGGRTLQNENTLTWSGGQILFNNTFTGGSGGPGSGTINNIAGATFTASGDSASSIAASSFGVSDDGTDALFTNAGTFRKSSSSATNITTVGVLFNNSGTVDVQTGSLNLSGGGIHTGNFTGLAGIINFSGGTHQLNAGSSITTQNVNFGGSGTTTINGTYNVSGSTGMSGGNASINGTLTSLGSALNIFGGILNLNASNATVATLTQISGGLAGTGNLTVTGAATITFGDHRGSGTTILQGPSTISGSGFRLDGGRTLRNENILTWSGGAIVFNNTFTGGSGGPGSGTINNIAGATFIASGNSAASIFASNFSAGDNGADALFTNAGAFRKSDSADNNTTAVDVVFNNTGTVDVLTGILDLTNGGTHTGNFTGTAGTIGFGGGTHLLNASSNLTTQNVRFSGSGTTTINGTYNVAGTTSLTAGSASIGGTLTSLGAALNISAGLLNLNASNASVGTLTQSGGGLDGTGTLTVTGAATITYGDHRGTGTTILHGPTTISSSGFRLDGGRTLRNQNILTWSGGQINLNNTFTGGSGGPGSGAINNIAGATFIASGNSATSIAASSFSVSDNGSDALFTNAGTFRKSGSSDTSTTTVDVIFDNTGTVDVLTGILNLTNGGTHTGNFAVAAGAVIGFGGGTHQINAGTITSPGTVRLSGSTTVNLNTAYAIAGTTEIQSGSLNLLGGNASTGALIQSGGTVAGTGDFTVSGGSAFSSGDHRGNGTTILQGPATISSGGLRLDGGRTLRNQNTLTWSAGQILFNNNINGTSIPGSGTINNIAGATFIASGNGANSIAVSNFSAGDNGSDALFTNAGTFRKSGSSDTSTTTVDVIFDNTGTVDVLTGILNLTNGGTHTGNFAVAAGAVLGFGGGTHQINAGTITSPGTVRLSGSTTVNLNTAYAIAGTTEIQSGSLNLLGGNASTGALIQSGGTVAGTGDFTVSGGSAFSSGDHRGNGTTILQGPATISSGGLRLDGGRTLRNQNTLTWSAGQILFNNNINGTSIPGSGTINNIAGATFIASGNGATSIAASNFSAGDNGSDALFTNAGTFRKTGSNDTSTTTVDVTFNNTGTVDVDTGILDLRNGGTHSGNFDVAAGTVLGFGGGTHRLTGGTATGSGTLRLSTGVLDITNPYTVASAFSMTNGSVQGADLTLSGPASFTFGDHRGSGTTILQGPTTISGSGFRLDGGRTLRNQNTLTWSAGQILFNNNVNGTSIPTSGTINNSAGATFIASGDSAFSITASNFGAGDDGADALFTNAGTFRKSGSIATSTTTVDVAFNNTGLVEVLSGNLNFSNFNQTAGETRLTGGTLLSFNNINITGGILSGQGIIDINNSGIDTLNLDNSRITPGTGVNDYKTLTIEGNLQGSGDSSVDIEIGSLTSFDVLNIINAANFITGDRINITTAVGFTPNAGDSFRVLTYGSAPADLASRLQFTNLFISPTLSYQPIFNTNDVTLQVVQTAAPGSFSINNASVVEGNGGTRTIVFTVSLDNAVAGGASVSYATANGTATAGVDYAATSGTLNFTGIAGETQTISVTVNGDSLVELNESFLVNLSNPTNGALIADGQGVGTITNDDAATLNIFNVVQSEGNTGTTEFLFNVSLTAAVDVPISVDFATNNNTATLADNDFQAASGTLNFSGTAGETRQISINVVGDTNVESNENFFVNLSNLQAGGRNVSLGASQGVGTIVNDDVAALPTITLAVSPASVLENGATNLVYTFTRTGATTNPLTVDYTIGGSATNGTDYGLIPASVSFAAGSATATVTVDPTGDAVVEANETVSLTLAANAAYSIGTAGAVIGTISNDDTAGITVTTGPEGFRPKRLTTTEGTTDPTVIAAWRFDETSGSTAFAAAGTVNGSLLGNASFSAGGLSGGAVTMSTAGNGFVDMGNNFSFGNTNSTFSLVSWVKLQSGDTNGYIVAGRHQAGAIAGYFNGINNTNSGSGEVTGGAIHYQSYPNPVSTNLGLNDGNWHQIIGVHDFNAGSLAQSRLYVNGELVDTEGYTGFNSSLANFSVGGILNAAGTQMIGALTGTVDEVSIWSRALTASDARYLYANPGALAVTPSFTVVLNSQPTADVTIGISSSDTTEGTVSTSSLVFTPANWNIPQTVTVTSVDDAIVDRDDNGIANGIGVAYSIVTAAATSSDANYNGLNADDVGVTNLDNDAASLSIDDVTVTEGDSGTKLAVFTVTLSNAVAGGVSVNYATANGTATVGSDYVNNFGTINFTGTAGETKTVSVTINGDSTIEDDETFVVNLSGLTKAGVTIADSQGVGTITNDDLTQLPVITLEVAPASVLENGAGNITYTFTRTGATTNPLTVNYTIGGTATNGADYGTIPASVTFAAGSATATVTVDPTADSILEPNETVSLTLTSNAAYSIGTAGAVTGTITNDDDASFSISDVTVVEGNTGTRLAVFTVTLSNAVAGGASVAYATAANTATAGSDYIATAGTLNFTGTAGEQLTVSVTINGDTTVEPNESFFLNLSAPTNGVTLADGQGRGTIINDDVPPQPAGTPVLFFSAVTAANGRELWLTDGTQAGTRQVIDAFPGATGAFPSTVQLVNGTLLFASDDAAGDTELWFTDGTTAGTAQLVEINPVTSASSAIAPTFITPFDGGALFFTDDGISGNELWFTDGTASGTRLLADIQPGPTGSRSATNPARQLTVSGGKVFFTANTSAAGNELWVIESVAAGPRLVRDILPGSGSSGISVLTAFNEGVFLYANDGLNGVEAWFSDGTAAGTASLGNLSPLAAARATNPTVVGDKVFFAIEVSNTPGVLGGELWVSNGTVANTTRLLANVQWPINTVGAINGKAVFIANDGVSGSELWISDGTPSGTRLLKDIQPGGINSNGALAAGPGIVFNGELYFRGTTTAEGAELWKTDGTEAGTVLVADINPGTGSSNVSLLFSTILNGRLYFQASTPGEGLELWSTDGTAAGTTRVADINPGTAGSTPTNFSVQVLAPPVVSISLTPATVEEGEAFTLTATRGGAVLSQPTTVTYTITGAAATAGDIVTPLTGTITILANQTTATLTIATVDDAVLEANEAFTVTITNPVNGSIGTATATATIIDDDTAPLPLITLAVSPASVLENGAANLVYTFTRTGATTNPLTVNYAINGTATGGTDYGAILSSVTFAAGSDTATVTVDPTGDTVLEPNETVSLTLTADPAYLIGTPGAVTGTITNDDDASFSIGDVSIVEGNSGTSTAIFTVTLSNAVAGGASVNFATADGTASAGSDYVATSGTLNFAGTAGETQTVAVTISGDTVFEPNETFFLNLTAPTNGVTLLDGQGLGTITNDDAAPLPVITLAVSPASVLENGAANLDYTFTRTGATTNPLTVNYAINGTATGGTDYGAILSSVTFAAGSDTATVTVDPTGDTVLEPNETVSLTLTADPAYLIGTPGAVTGTITNDDDASFSIGDVSIVEGNSGTSTAIFTVTLSNAVAGGASVNFATADGTASAGSDYVGTSGTLAFAGTAGETQTVAVTISGDTVFEPNETFFLNLTAPTNGVTLLDGQGLGTITNDDAAPLPVITLAVSPASVLENGAANLDYTFTRIGATTDPLTVNYTIGGTATGGTDYGAILSSVTFAAGSDTATVTVDPTGDTVLEPNETVSLTLTADPAYLIGTTGAVTGTITNDDAASFSIGDVSIVEGNSGTSTAIFTVTLSNAVAGGASVNFATADGTATAGSDYVGTSGTLAFAGTAGETQTVAVTISGDTVFEPNETFFLNLTAPTNGVTLLDGQGLGTITNDDGSSITGTRNRDTLIGTAGDDLITGLQGADTIRGNGGADRFVYTSIVDAGDTIIDFNRAEGDKVDLTGALASVGYTGTTPITDGYLKFVTIGSDTMLQIDPDGSGLAAARNFILFTNVSLATLSNPDNFSPLAPTVI